MIVAVRKNGAFSPTKKKINSLFCQIIKNWQAMQMCFLWLPITVQHVASWGSCPYRHHIFSCGVWLGRLQSEVAIALIIYNKRTIAFQEEDHLPKSAKMLSQKYVQMQIRFFSWIMGYDKPSFRCLDIDAGMIFPLYSQYIQLNMHIILFLWSIYLYLAGLLHRHWGNRMVTPLIVKTTRSTWVKSGQQVKSFNTVNQFR